MTQVTSEPFFWDANGYRLFGDHGHSLCCCEHGKLGKERSGGADMAYWIDLGCTACGECLPKCPNDAISKGTPIYRIEPLLCTECVGYDDRPQCVDACPEGVIHLGPGTWNLVADGKTAHGPTALKG